MILIVFIIIVTSNAVSALQAITDSIDSGEITAEFVSTGSASGHIADLTITSNSDMVMELCLINSGLIGMVLENSATDEQDEIITDTPGVSTGPGETTYSEQDSVFVSPGETVTLPLIGYCINYDLSNPTEGTIFNLNSVSGKTDITQLSSVLETLTTYSFPGGFTNDDIYNVVQIAIWAAQPENINVYLEDYATRGYSLDDTDVSVVDDFLNTSGIDTTNIVALSGKKKETTDDEEEEETTTEEMDIPWTYIAIPLILVAVGAGGYFAYNSRKKPRGGGPTDEEPISDTDSHISSYSTPTSEGGGTASKACGKSCTATCDLKCEGQCIAFCERASKSWDPEKRRGVSCKYACMGSCTFKCTSWSQ